MAKNRRSNPLALAVLALLFERPMHPYEIAITLRVRRKEDSIKIRFGSLYTVIDLLKKDGLILPRETCREGRRPERTVYELSPPGKAEMTDWLCELIGKPFKEYTRFEAGLCLLPALKPDQAVDLLKRRVQSLENDCRQLRFMIDSSLGRGLPPLVLIEHEYRFNRLDAERQFVNAMLRRIELEGWIKEGVWNQLHGICSNSEGDEGQKSEDTEEKPMP